MGDKINILAMKDTVRNSKIALPVIMVFEIYMLISWLTTVTPSNSVAYYGYPVEYALLLIVTAGVYIALLKLGKDLGKYHKRIANLQRLYALFFVIWAVAFTYIGAIYRNSFSELLYLTIITLIPMFCYANPLIWGTVQSLSAVVMLYIAYRSESHFVAFRTNFIVFTLISIIAARSLYRVRKDSYARQLLLEESAETNRRLALYDALTGLPNRRSYEEKIAEFSKLRQDGKGKNCYIGMFDLNGLKKANDNLGHEAGDKLIAGAAFVLNEAFRSVGSVYRVGGDEFAGVFEMSDKDLQEAMQRLIKLMDDWTQRNDMKLSIAYGFAGGEKCSLTIEEMEAEADNAMYDNKKKYHDGERRV